MCIVVKIRGTNAQSSLGAVDGCLDCMSQVVVAFLIRGYACVSNLYVLVVIHAFRLQVVVWLFWLHGLR